MIIFPCTQEATASSWHQRRRTDRPQRPQCPARIEGMHMIRQGMTVRSPRSTTSSAWVKYEATSHLVPTASIRLPRTATKPSNGRSPVPVKTLLDVRTVKQSDITTTYTGSMPEIAVTIRPKTTMKMKNFQMVFRHWPNEILATASAGDRHARHGTDGVDGLIGKLERGNGSFGIKAHKLVSGPMTGMVKRASPELEGTSKEGGQGRYT